MQNSSKNPYPLERLITTLRVKFGHTLEKRRVKIFDHPRPSVKRAEWYNTQGFYVVVDDTEYRITKKTLKERGVLTLTGDIFSFDEIEDSYIYEWPELPLEEYIVGTYRNYLGDGWYSNTPLYLYEGNYYTDLN